VQDRHSYMNTNRKSSMAY